MSTGLIESGAVRLLASATVTLTTGPLHAAPARLMRRISRYEYDRKSVAREESIGGKRDSLFLHRLGQRITKDLGGLKVQTLGQEINLPALKATFR